MVDQNSKMNLVVWSKLLVRKFLYCSTMPDAKKGASVQIPVWLLTWHHFGALVDDSWLKCIIITIIAVIYGNIYILPHTKQNILHKSSDFAPNNSLMYVFLSTFYRSDHHYWNIKKWPRVCDGSHSINHNCGIDYSSWIFYLSNTGDLVLTQDLAKMKGRKCPHQY